MPSNRWVDRSQPQTLMMATVVMYINAVLGIGAFLVSLPLAFFLVICPVAAGWGIANEKKWGYWLCVGCATLYLLFWLALIVVWHIFTFGIVLNVLFAVVLMVLLLHPMSREYQRIWFH